MKSKEEIKEGLENAGMIPVFYHQDEETCIQTLRACYLGGVRVFEFVNRGENAYNTFLQLRSYVNDNCPEMILAIGSILDEENTLKFIEAGADIIISPIMNPQMAKACQEKNINWIPGCGTLTEIVNGVNLGAPIVKVFPGTTYGPEFIKAVLGPIPTLKLMPTGGVKPELENLKAWFDAGVITVGMGSQLFNKELLANKEFNKITKKVISTFEIIKGLK